MCGCECLHACERKWKKGKEIYGEKQVQELQEEREYETKPASSLATECKCCTLPAKKCIQTHTRARTLKSFLAVSLSAHCCTPTAIWYSSPTEPGHSCKVELGHCETE